MNERKRRKAYLIYFGFSKKEWAAIAFCFSAILGAILFGKLTIYAGDSLLVKGLPGEFARQQAVWIMWPSEVYNADESPIDPVMLTIVKNLVRYVDVNVIADDAEQRAKIKRLLAGCNCPESRIKYYIVHHYSMWARDVGPVFVQDKKNRLCVVDFKFNNYGRYGDHYYVTTEGQVDGRVARLLNLPRIDTELVSEGGSVESNGKGTLLLTEAVTLKHNTGLSEKMIEDEYKRVLGARKIIWLKKGLAEDKVTGGHVDEFVRFAGPDTILLAEVLPIDQESSPMARQSSVNLEENYRILIRATDQDGHHFRIIRIPMPPTLYGDADEEDEIPVCSYLNYIVTNGAVLVQSYWKPGRPYILKATEKEAMRTLGIVFPGREIIPINAENINAWGGGLHCITQHMPADRS